MTQIVTAMINITTLMIPAIMAVILMLAGSLLGVEVPGGGELA